MPLVGSVLLLFLACYLVRTAERSRTAEAAIYACAVGAFVQSLLSAYGRFKLGTGQASESRYGYVAIVLLAPAVAMVVDGILGGRGLPLRVACVAVFVLLAVTNAHLLRLNATKEEAREVALRGLILSAAHIANDPSQRARARCEARTALFARPHRRRPASLRQERRAAEGSTVA